MSSSTDDMGPPLELLSSLESSLNAFLQSDAKFKIIRGVCARLSSAGPDHVSTRGKSAAKPQQVRTLLILDSSFNPPTRAHLSMATSAFKKYLSLQEDSTKSTQRQNLFPPPYSIILLFSVHNADKSPAPTAFPHRLALMTASANDIADSLMTVPGQPHQKSVDIDVAVTKEPFYSDKSAAIEATSFYRPGPSRPHHVHLIGYDTFVRFLNPKYYSNFSPPLSALDRFFEHHGLRLTLRASSSEEATEQRRTFEKLAHGDLKNEGGRREWAERIDMVQGENESVGVSSTAVRQACEKGDWKTVEDLCSPRVADWVKSNSLYCSDPTGKI